MISELLTSLKKMEDSLKRLKKGKGNNSVNTTTTSATMTDEDKIRLQILLDVQQVGCNVRIEIAPQKRGRE